MKVMLDTKYYKFKPDNELGIINNRIKKNPVDISPEELAQELSNGKSFVPGFLNTPDGYGNIERQEKYWTYQEIICLDFDNDKEEYFSLDDAINEFKNDAMFIYTTFKHKSKKYNYKDRFRVVFALDEKIYYLNELKMIIDYFVQKYPIDGKCNEGSRIFFGGINLIPLDYNNRLNKNEILSKYYNLQKGFIEEEEDLPPYRNITYTYRSCRGVNFRNQMCQDFNQDLACECQEEQKIFYNKYDVKEYLYKNINLFDYLGIEETNKNFHCIFHEDNDPSANIFLTDEGNYIYKCFSNNCGFIGNIISVTEKLYDIDSVQAFNYLCDLYNIKIEETEWQKNQKEILDHNIDYLVSGWMKIEHPHLYRKIKRYIPLLLFFNLLARRYVGSEMIKNAEQLVFFIPVRNLLYFFNDFIDDINFMLNDNTKLTNDFVELNKRINFFAFLGIIEKLHTKNVPEEIYNLSKKIRDRIYKKTGKKIYMPNYYTMNMYTNDNLRKADKMAQEYDNKNMSMAGFSRELLIRSFGKEVADRVYPMKEKYKLTDKDEEISLQVKAKFLDLINKKGWVTEREVFEKLYGGKKKKEKLIKKNLQELLDEYNLKRVRLNKELKKQYGISINGYPYVIIPNGDNLND